MFRLIATTIYVFMLLSLSGLCKLAVAATSCQEGINPSFTNNTYADALVHFVYINGKTYAVSKSAVTGATTGPDAYFAFSANIDRQYTMTGEDLSSLKRLLALGRYGDARPVTVPDAATRDLLITQFGRFLSMASSQQSTYIDGWKEFGLNAPFLSMSGSPLVFTSWPGNVAPDVSTISEPQALAMGNDGTWLNGAEGIRTSQIVEFDGKLDCAIDLTPSTEPIVTPAPATDAAQICATDLNGNDDIEENESAPCVQTNQGMFCPVGAVSCDNPPHCGQGTYNTTTRMCEWTSETTYDAITNNVGGVDFTVGVSSVCSSYFGSACTGHYELRPTQFGMEGAVAYLSTASFTGSVAVYSACSSMFGSACIGYRYLTSNPYNGGSLVGYISATPFAGSVPIAQRCTSYFGNTCIGQQFLAITTYNSENIVGYAATTQGAQGTVYTCNPGDTLSVTSCTHTTVNQGPVTCPLGSQYTCMDNNGSLSCSPNQCFAPASPPGGSVDVEMDDDDMLQDDARNPDGSCGGQLIIFNGKRSRCRPPGLKVGMINNCCEGDEVMSEDTGNNIATAVSAVKTAYQIGQVAYYSYMISTGSAAFSAGATAGTVTVTSLATSASTTLSGAVASGVSGSVSAMGAGASTAGAVTAGLQSYAAALLNPATIAVAVVVMAVMRVLMGNGCDQGDIQTSMQNESRQCHYVGSYCQTRWPLVGCVQRARGYCCFNSIMSRIIHEQGRPQLAAFGANGGWGSPEHPNCRGFTPAEFEALDFAKIDMSEYYQEFQDDLAGKINDATDRINTTIQNRVNQINP